MKDDVTICQSSARTVGPEAIDISLDDINDVFDFVWLLFAYITISGISPISAVKLSTFLWESDESNDNLLIEHSGKSRVQLSTNCSCNFRQLSAFLNLSFLSANKGKI